VGLRGRRLWRARKPLWLGIRPKAASKTTTTGAAAAGATAAAGGTVPPAKGSCSSNSSDAYFRVHFRPVRVAVSARRRDPVGVRDMGHFGLYRRAGHFLYHSCGVVLASHEFAGRDWPKERASRRGLGHGVWLDCAHAVVHLQHHVQPRRCASLKHFILL